MSEETVSVERDDRNSVLIRITSLIWFPDHREICVYARKCVYVYISQESWN